MSDAQEIHSLLSEEQFDKAASQYSDVQYEYIGDLNNGSYTSNNLLFDTLPVRSRWWIPADSYLSIPISVKCATGAAVSTLVAFKRSVVDMIYSVQVQAASGSVIVNDVNLPLINYVRMLINLDYDQWGQMCPELHITKDTVSVKTSSSGGAFDIANPVPAANLLNDGFLERVKCLKQGATYTAGTTVPEVFFATVINIPLRYIHPFFAACDFPLINQRFQLQFGLSTGDSPIVRPLVGSGALTAGTIGLVSGAAGLTASFTYPASTTTGVVQAVTLTPSQAAVAAAGACTVTVANATIPGTNVQINQARLYIKSVKFSPEVNVLLSQKLSSGFVRKIDFYQSDVYMGQGAAETGVTAAGPYTKLVSPSTVRPTRVFLVGMPNGAATDSTSLSTFIAQFSNCNVLINNQRYYNQDLITPREQFEILKDQMNGGGLITYKDFLSHYRIICFDLSRMGDKMQNENEAVSIQVQATRVDTVSSDYCWMVERLSRVSFHMSSQDSRVVVGLAQ